jgi:hypothetical protein
MNGRVYDQRIGRFLSADPLVQDPQFTQSFNRYSYTFNNPLRYTDPSGYSAADDPPAPRPDPGYDPCAFCRVPPRVPRIGTPIVNVPLRDGAHVIPASGLECDQVECEGGGTQIGASTVGEMQSPTAAPGVVQRSPRLRRTTVDQAINWLRTRGLIDFDIEYEDRYVRLLRLATGAREIDCGADPTCGGIGILGGLTFDRDRKVKIYRAGVEPELWKSKKWFYADDAITDPSRQKWGEEFTPGFQSDFEFAIFVIGHEKWHIDNPGMSNGSPEDEPYEWRANMQGYLFLMRYRQQLRRGR